MNIIKENDKINKRKTMIIFKKDNKDNKINNETTNNIEINSSSNDNNNNSDNETKEDKTFNNILPEQYKDLSEEELAIKNQEELNYVIGTIDENGNIISVPEGATLDNIKTLICNQTIEWNNFIDSGLGYTEENGFDQNEYSEVINHNKKLIESFTDPEVTSEKYLTYEVSNYTLDQIQSYIRFCIAYDMEKYYQPYYEILPQANNILVNYMKINHPKFDKIDNIYIKFLDEVELFDWSAKNAEIYFSSNNKNYIAYAYIAKDEDDIFTFKLLDIKEE